MSTGFAVLYEAIYYLLNFSSCTTLSKDQIYPASASMQKKNLSLCLNSPQRVPEDMSDHMVFIEHDDMLLQRDQEKCDSELLFSIFYYGCRISDCVTAKALFSNPFSVV